MTSQQHEIDLFRTAGGQKLHVPYCPHVHGVEMTVASIEDRLSMDVCEFCEAEVSGRGRTTFETIEDALRSFNAPHHSRARMAELLGSVERDSVHTPASNSYIAVVKDGQAVAWAGKTYVEFANGEFHPFEDFVPSGGGARGREEVWGERCDRCFMTKSLNGACGC
jgi:hypothetical protein